MRFAGRDEAAAKCVDRIVAGIDAVDGTQSFERFRLDRAHQIGVMVGEAIGKQNGN